MGIRLILGWVLMLSLLTLAAYAVDKHAARSGAWRVRERTLLALALMGGWPGALLGQHLLRHKVQKTRFKALNGMMALINVLVVIAFVSGLGT